MTMRAIALGIASASVFVGSALSQETPRTAESLECSKQADAQGLHGVERAAFRSQCKANAGQPAQQTTQQAVKPAAFVTTQECSAKYQAAKAVGTLAGRQWMEFRRTECGLPTQPALKLVFPKGISPIYAQEPEAQARMHTCADQYNSNKASNASGGLKWIEPTGGGYYAGCNERLKIESLSPTLPPRRPPGLARNVDVFAYCKDVINLDNHGDTTINNESDAIVAKAVNTKPFDWRCMDGEVLACETGASGSACQKMSTNKQPTTAISTFCLQQPNTQFVPNVRNWKLAGIMEVRRTCPPDFR
jgi:hypothetical protein